MLWPRQGCSYFVCVVSEQVHFFVLSSKKEINIIALFV